MSLKLRLALILLLLALAVTGCHKPADAPQGKDGVDGGGKKGPQAVPVVVAPVVLQDYAPALELSGEMRAVQRATLAAEVSGKVVAIARRVGESCPANAGALISIDPTSYRTAVAAAQADLDAARQNLLRLQNGARPQEIAVQEAAVAVAQTKYDQALDNLQRQQELFNQGAIAEKALIDARAAVDTARSELAAQQQKLDQLRQGNRQEDIGVAQAQVDQARNRLAAAEQQLARTSIVPAFAATVTALYVEVGQYVGPGTAVCEIVADAPGEAWFNLPQDQMAGVKNGTPVEIRTGALPGEVFSGKVASISPAADTETRQFPVRVVLQDKRLKPGMAVTGRILLGEPKPTLMISIDAPLEGKLGLVVYRVVAAGAGGKEGTDNAKSAYSVELVPVETGPTVDGSVVLVTGELKVGDLLVTRGKEQLFAAAKVTPVNLDQHTSAAAGKAQSSNAQAGGAK